jgi:serine/threonine protein kinase
VHRVRSRLDFREYALKIIEIKPNQCKQDVIDTIHKFLDEVKILSYLNHKNIIEYHGCWVECEVGDEIIEVKNHESEEE